MHTTSRAHSPLRALGLLVVLAATMLLASSTLASDEHGTTPPAHGESHDAAPAHATPAEVHDPDVHAADPHAADPHAVDAHAAADHAHESHTAVPHLQNALGLLINTMTDAEGEPTPTATFLRNFTDPIFSLLEQDQLSL